MSTLFRDYHEATKVIRCSAHEAISAYIDRCGLTTVRNLGSAHHTTICKDGFTLYIGSQPANVVDTETLCVLADMLNKMP